MTTNLHIQEVRDGEPGKPHCSR